MQRIPQSNPPYNTPQGPFSPTPEPLPGYPGAAPNNVPRSARQLLDLIVETIGPHGTEARLSQQRLAARLEVSDTTIRRYTKALTDAGLIHARRGRNCVIFTRPQGGSAASAPHLRDDPAVQPPELPPQRCPAHHRARVSDMTQHTAYTVWHCTKLVHPHDPRNPDPRNRYCSWLLHERLGTIREPNTVQLTLEEVLQLEAGFNGQYETRHPAPVEYITPPFDRNPVLREELPETQAHTGTPSEILQRIAAAIPDPVRADILSRHSAVSTVGPDCLTIQVSQSRYLAWLDHPLYRAIAEQTASMAMQRPTSVQFVA